MEPPTASVLLIFSTRLPITVPPSITEHRCDPSHPEDRGGGRGTGRRRHDGTGATSGAGRQGGAGRPAGGRPSGGLRLRRRPRVRGRPVEPAGGAALGAGAVRGILSWRDGLAVPPERRSNRKSVG